MLASFLTVAFAPGAAQAEPASSCPAAVAADATPVSTSEDSAHRLAALCAKPVEVLAGATPTTKVVALPTGGFQLESSVEPQRVERAGEWVDIDTNLVAGADGQLRPVAAADVTFSPGGSAAPFASMRDGGADFTLAWPAALPRGVVTGDSITYPGVFPDVDLVVRATPGGFSHVLVVKSAEAAANPAVRETRYRIGGSAEVSASGGEVVISGPAGVIAEAPQAAAWDSAPAPVLSAPLAKQRAIDQALAPGAAPIAGRSTAGSPGDTAKLAEVDVRVGGGELTVAVDEALLATDHFPVFIDPTYEKAYNKWIPVRKKSPDTRWTSGNAWPREEIRVGSNYDDYSDVWRAHFQFDITVLKGKRIVKTPSVDGYMIKTGWCAGEQIGIWQTNAIDGNTPTWDGMSGKWLHGKPLQTKTAKANANCSGQKPAWIKFNAAGVKSNVQRHADANYASITFGLRVSTESGGHWVKFERGKVKLIAEYQSKPTSPVAVRSSPGGNCNKTSPGPWINDNTPTLYGKASDGDNSVKTVYDLNGPTTPADYKSAAAASGKETNWTTGALKVGNYKWRVQGTDDVSSTAWTDYYCYFRVDNVPPAPPVVKRISGTPVVGQPVTLELKSTDANSFVKHFQWGLADSKDNTKPVTSAASVTTQVTFTAEAGRTQFYVWSQDNALNYSTRTVFNFYSGRITDAESRGVWRLNSDQRDDSASEADLTLGSGVSYGTDRFNKAGSALTFTGAGCAETPPVVRSDQEFTVAGWVKLTDKTAYRAFAAQVGTNMAGWVITYNNVADRWEVGQTSADVAAPKWTVARAPAAPVLNAWQHIAVTSDPVGKVLRLFIDGKPAVDVPIVNPPWDAQARFTIGCSGSATTTGYPMKGSIDQVGIWQGLLSEAQIAAAAGELPAGLVANWPMRGDGADATGRGKDLTVPEILPEPEAPDTDPTPEPEPDPTDGPNPAPGEPEPTEAPAPQDPEPTGPVEVPGEDPTDEPTTPAPIPTAPVRQSWVDDQFGRTESAWASDGGGCATTTGSALRTDESFSVSAWAKLSHAGTTNQTVLGQDGGRVSAWYLGARVDGTTGVRQWTLTMPFEDNENGRFDSARSTAEEFAASAGKWTHLTAVFDATAKKMHLYVNGKLAGSVDRTGSAWNATGPFTVGCARFAGVATDYFGGAISDVRAWRGALTAAEVATVHGGNAAVTLEGMWPLDGPRADEPTNLDDRSGNGRHLTVAGDYTWARDRGAGRDGALGLELAAGSCAETAGPVVRTDGSLTVAAWVVLDQLTGTRTVVSQSGAVRQGFRIEYFGDANRWRLVMPAGDTDAASLAEVRSLTAPTAGEWTHLAAVYDLTARKARLYVNGDLQGEVAAPVSPWHAAGPLTIGCAGSTDGRRSNYLGGVVDDVRVWTSTVDPDLFGTFAHG